MVIRHGVPFGTLESAESAPGASAYSGDAVNQRKAGSGRHLMVIFASTMFFLASCGSTTKKTAATTTTTAAATTTTTAVKVTTTPAPVAPIPTTTVTTVASSVPSGFTKESATGSLAQGDFGPRVASVQKKLKAIGNDPGPADGAFGEQTVKAVKAFQTAKTLKADGIVGPQTQAAIDAACSKASC
jgi:hypothetical protein